MKELIPTDDAFASIYAAHRLYFQYFGDTRPVSSLDDMPARISQIFTMESAQYTEVRRIIEENRDVVQYAFPYTIVVYSDGTLHAQEGHEIDTVFANHALLCRGMLLRLGGDYDGTVVLQVDDRGSRSLIDTMEPQQRINVLLNAMLLEKWVRGDERDTHRCTVHVSKGGRIYDHQLVIADHNLTPIISYQIHGLKYAPTGEAAALFYPNIHNLYYQIEADQ